MSDDGEIIGGASIPLPPELIAAMREGRERHHMQADSEDARMLRVLDAMDVDSLMAMRWLLRTNPEHAFANNMRHDGIIETLLRVVHKVDPETGEDPAAKLLEEEPTREPWTPKRDDDPPHEQ